MSCDNRAEWTRYLNRNDVCLTWSSNSPPSKAIMEINSRFKVLVVINHTGKSLLVIDQKIEPQKDTEL